MASPTRPTRVAVVCPVLAHYDAIGAAGRDTYLILSRHSDFDVSVLTFRNDYDDVPARTISGLADLLLDPAFQAADIIIYHFGIYCELFDALIAAKGRARQFVHFHNITPPQFVPPAQRQVIDRSFLQVHNLEQADEVWAVSHANAEALETLGIDPARIQVIPLAVENPTRRTLCGKAPTPLNLLFVGRFVQSKGVLDLVEAVDLVRRRCTVPFRLRLAGNLEWSDQKYLTTVKEAITARKLDMTVEILGTVNAEVLEDLYHMSHVFAIPSYHEGFCKPVIEALRAGCIPIGYDGYNLPAISNGLGRMVPTGDTHALAAALAEVMEGVVQSFDAPEEPLLPLDKGRISAREFDRAAGKYVQSFTLNRLASAILARIRAVHFGNLSKSTGDGEPVTTLDELRHKVFSRPWFHRIDLGNGIVTPGIDNSVEKLSYLDLPADLGGKSVLDIGAYDGFFSFEAERRGAARVVAADYFCWTLTGMADKRGFDIAHAALNSKVEAILIPVEEMSPKKLGTFDLVLFLGVLYHSQDPLRYLRIVRSLCKHQLILETHVDAIDYPRPAMVFYPGATLNNDASNFWGPNPQAVEAMLLEVGFPRVKRICTYGSRLVVHAFV